MDAEPKYALEALDRVFRAMGCPGGKRGLAWMWKNPNENRPGQTSYFSYVPDRGCSWILQGDVVTGALRLQKDPDEVVRRLKQAGGEILDP